MKQINLSLDGLISKDHFERFHRKDVKIPIDLQKYNLRIIKKEPGQQTIGRLILPTDYTTILFYEQKPIAGVAMDFDETSAEFMSITGSAGCYKELTPLIWNVAMVKPTLVWLRKNGVAMAKIPKAEHVKGWTPENHYRLERRYDGTAMHLGFTDNHNHYSKDL